MKDVTNRRGFFEKIAACFGALLGTAMSLPGSTSIRSELPVIGTFNATPPLTTGSLLPLFDPATYRFYVNDELVTIGWLEDGLFHFPNGYPGLQVRDGDTITIEPIETPSLSETSFTLTGSL